MRSHVPVLALASLLAAGSLSAQRLSYEGGLSVSTGTYLFTERTTAMAFTSGLRFDRGRVSLRIGMPVWLQNTTLLTASPVGPLPTGGPEGQRMVRDSGQARHQHGKEGMSVGTGGSGTNGGIGGSEIGSEGPRGGDGSPGGLHRFVPTEIRPTRDLTESAIPAPEEALTGYDLSLGDPMVSLAVRLRDASRVRISVGGTVKVPVASSTTVGSGHWDLGGSLSMTALLGKDWSAGLDVARWHLGDLDSLVIRDPWLGTASVGKLLGRRWGALISLAASTSPLTGFAAPVTASIAFSHLTPASIWGISLGAGLSETAPDLLVTISWSVSIARGRAR